MRKSRGVTTYSGAHWNVSYQRGKAIAHRCPCGEQAREWALRHDAPGVITDADSKTFSLDANDYTAMCLRCHRIYDKSVITHCPQGHQYTDDNTLIDAGKRKCKTCAYARNRKRKPTPQQQQRRTELQRIRRQRAKERVA